MSTLRKRKSEVIYKKHLKNRKENGDDSCPMCERKSEKSFKFWKIIKNKFPYDKVAEEHLMLVPIRHVVESELNKNELKEFGKIKNSILKVKKYDFIMEAVKWKTIPSHFHLHLIVLK